MFSKLFVAATAASSLIASSAATYNPTSTDNVAVYWGQGAGQARLATTCDQESVDIIPIGFINRFLAQGNGYVGANFANACWGAPYNYEGPGYGAGGVNPANNHLPTHCPTLQEDIPYCQKVKNKKIVLSLGGAADPASPSYKLTGRKEGEDLADFLWGAYGPFKQSWVDAGKPRPLDTNSTYRIDIDGFDFDIEAPSADNQAGYVACATKLRRYFAEAKAAGGKDYILTGAPQCPLAELNMGRTISLVQFDALFIQFYSNGGYGCNARNWTNSNKNYAATGVERPSSFNYDAWLNEIHAGASKDAKLYIGLLGSNYANARADSDYINAAEAKDLITAYHKKPQFGGVMLWEAENSRTNPEGVFYDLIKGILTNLTPKPTTTSSTVSSTTTTTSLASTTSSIISTTTTSASTASSSTVSSSTSSSSTSSSSTASSSTTSSSTVSSSTSSSSTSSSSTASSSTASSSTASSSTSLSSTISSSTSTSSVETATTSVTSAQSTTSGLSNSTTSLGSVTSASGDSSSTSTVMIPTGVHNTTTAATSSTSGHSLPTAPSSSVYSNSTAVTKTSTSIHTQPTTNVPSIPTSSQVPGVPAPSSSRYPTLPPYANSTFTTHKPTSLGGGVTTKVPLTTSVVYTTITETVTKCPPSVPNCPIGSVTTKTIPLYTTICPAIPTSNGPVVTTPAAPKPTKYTTSVVYTTTTYTVTACPDYVTKCPVGSITTVTIPAYTTICPVSDATSAPAVEPTTTLPSTTTESSTVIIIKTTQTIVAIPVSTKEPEVHIPYPTGSTPGGGEIVGTGHPSASLTTSTPVSSGVPSASSSHGVDFTGAASNFKNSMGITVAAAIAGLALLM